MKTKQLLDAEKKDAVFQASIEFIGTLTGMKPPPIETAPPETFAPFRAFTERVCEIFAAIEADIAKPSEPVGAESRFTESSAWLRCSVEHHYLVSAKPDEWPGYETRLLYTTPQEPAAAEIPEGWKLVPIEPNDAMQTAGAQAVRFDTTVINKIWTGNAVYRAMLAAAPGGAA